jgi:glutamate dehydrogenase
MSKSQPQGRFSPEQLKKAIETEGEEFQRCYLWLDQHMPPSFFEEVDQAHLMLVAHQLVGFPLNEFFTEIHIKDAVIVLCLDSPDADLRILREIKFYGIKNYQTFLSDVPPPFPDIKAHLRVAVIHFTVLNEPVKAIDEVIPNARKVKIFERLKELYPELTLEDFTNLLKKMNSRFLRSLPDERLFLALHMFFKAQNRDYCQFEVRYNEDWHLNPTETPSMQIVLAWKNTPKHQFLYRLTKMVLRHKLVMRRVNATYVDPYSMNSILIMSIALHGATGQAAWDDADIDDFLRELVTLKYFLDFPNIDSAFVDTHLLSGNMANFLKSTISFVHQALLQIDPNLYSIENIEEAICRHPELSVKLCELFTLKFDPKLHQLHHYKQEKETFLEHVNKLDTGHQINDTKRKNILFQSVNFIDHCLKTNFFRQNKSSIGFRLNPKYLDTLPFDRAQKFPELPYAIFFFKGMSFIGFHIRFEDLARGGLRTVIPQKVEQMVADRSNVFSECYNLAYTQHKKNKDIPEGGAKGVIFVEYLENLDFAMRIYSNELKSAKFNESEIIKALSKYKEEQRLVYLYQSQRSYIHSLMILINCEDDGTLKASDIVDYWKHPEYIYLGPDENMHNTMIEWIAEFSLQSGYKPKSAFISSKPRAGINHKEYGVTSLGVNVYMHEILLYLGINPEKDRFTIKITGGPDGDVAGNQILNLYRFYKNTAKLLAITDVSGTAFDPEGLDLESLVTLFKEEKPIRFYPSEKLHEGGFLLDLQTKRDDGAYSQQTLCWRRKGGALIQDWLGGSEMNHLYRYNVHQTVTDIFLPAGGRPRTLNKNNVEEFLGPNGAPTSKAIIEAANLYLTNEARYFLEKKGVIIIKDSSANKGGVICSSLEVQCGLVVSDEEFIENKPAIMKDVLEFIKSRARLEARLMLKTYDESKASLIDISDLISLRINTYMYAILNYLKSHKLSSEPSDPYIQCLLHYIIPYLRENHTHEVIGNIPDIHKKAIIATYIASKLVYDRGVNWTPSIVDILPVIIKEL